ncbi:glutamic-type intramembrane protease PrsW [Metabacillus fastidiosus]|uniref:Protease PrsW n=1 Tax=Metabacillus fastidiosus TaxID=1458 RepID=A0ABU6NWU4_9BACI|nr:glutamic-type intramembrane protease PrsW [Metabacillus fastidiosus]MED4400734.1 glutamic-type intramembrane protease PrsW [Metabacillus fastidiosus]MED4453690.1 glutamic-type intramembrane protease PrsW [Metabacillus fastidiosus]MED4462905.1 glutamic-type intramembrane protease PrsW [Metabacillus fastidiosus]
MVAIISAGIAPGLALLSYFYLKDQYETEPFYMVFRSFILGALLVFPIMFIQYVLEVEAVFTSSILTAFIAYGFLEEFFKWFILFFTIYQHVHFDEHYDGIVYGVSVSLGFASVENILYLFANGLEFAIGRAILPVSSHALFGVIMGYYLGKGKFTLKSNQLKWIMISVFLPIFLHGLYDTLLINFKSGRYIILPFMIFLWWFALRKAKIARMKK